MALVFIWKWNFTGLSVLESEAIFDNGYAKERKKEMGANVELDVFLRKEAFSLQHVFSLLEREGFFVNIQKVRVFNDWNYTNEKTIDKKDIDKTINNDASKKFMLIDFIVNNKWTCMLISSFKEDEYINLSFALDTDYLLQNGNDDLGIDVFSLYRKITDIIDFENRKEEFKERFIAASMGIEYSVHFNSNLLLMLNDDNGVKRWILPKDIETHIIPKKFMKEERSNTIVLTDKA